MKYVYALTTEEFYSEQDILNGDPTTSYFYVGWTKDINKRISSHKSLAKTGSEYPYHRKIRELKNNWDYEILEEIEPNTEHFAEEFHMINLTCQGHNLLNIKRGDIQKSHLGTVSKALKNQNITTGAGYAEWLIKNQDKKIAIRERKQIESMLKHIELCDCGNKRLWKLGDKELIIDRFIPRKDLIELLMPSHFKDFKNIMNMVNQIEKVT